MKLAVDIRGGRVPAQRAGVKRRVATWLHPTSSKNVTIWESSYNPDPNKYRCRVALEDMYLEEARDLRVEVAFSPSQFEADLWLPLDPFIIELLEQTNTMPVKLSLNATHILVSFILLCLSPSFEPTIDLLHHFFTFQATHGRV